MLLISISLNLSFSHRFLLHISLLVPFASYDHPEIRFPTEEELKNGLLLTVMARVEKMLSQVTAEHPFLQDPPLFQFLFGWARLHECTKEGDELAVFFRHCANK